MVRCFDQDKKKKNVRIEPIKRKVEETKQENSSENRHPWDIAQEIITEQKKVSLAVKWSAIPLEVLFDEQFLSILHAIEELTDVSSLQNAVTQLPKDIYKIVKQYEHIPKLSTKSIDDLIYNISKIYFYSVKESLCRLIKSIQQDQRTSLVSMAKVINEQNEVIGKYQELIKLPQQIKEMQDQLQKQIEQIKGRTAKHLERIDRRAITTYTAISEVRSEIHKIENTLENNNISLEQPERPGWVFPGGIVELYAPEDEDLFHTDEEMSSLNSEEVNHQANQQQTSEQDPIMGDIPKRLSPLTHFVPAGAEEGESISSQETASEPEITVEEGLTDFFSNPSHRATDPILQQPVETEEDWGDITPVEVPEQLLTPQPN